MRRSITAVISLVAAFAGAACEDGPSQTFTPAPTGAANVWNGTPASGGIPVEAGTFVNPATQSFDAQVGGQNANDLCTAAQEKVTWTDNFTMPIIPNPGLAAGLDLAGGPTGGGLANYDPACLSYSNCAPSATPPAYSYSNTTVEPWTGLTVDEAQALLCQSINPSPIFGPSSTQGQAGWGESDEVNALYNLNNRIVTDILLSGGYVGNLVGVCDPNNPVSPPLKGSVGYCPTKTTYTISMYNNVYMTSQVEGQQPENIVLNWSGAATPTVPVVANQIYEALREQWLPTFPPDADCVAAGHCIIDNNLTQDGILFFTPFNLAIFVLTTVGTPAANSIPFLIDVGVTKLLPFSDATVLMKLDSAGIGPTATTTAAQLGQGATQNCVYQLGQTWGQFDSTCVEPYPAGSPLNAVSKAKILGALAHGDEQYEFDIQGVDPQFTATLSPTQVIADGQTPTAADVAYQLTVDQFVLGPIANDFTNNDSTQAKDWHGIGLLTLEWAWLVHQYMQTNYGVNTDLGDPYCIANLTGATGLPLRPGALGGSTGGDAGSDAGGTADGGDAGMPKTPSCTATGGCAANESCVGSTGLPVTGTDKGTCAPKVCSGVEGIVTTVVPPTVAGSPIANHPNWAVNALGPAALSVDNLNPATEAPYGTCTSAQVQAGTCSALNQLSVGMKPGTWYTLLCADAGGLDKGGFPKGYQTCLGGTGNSQNAYEGYLFDTMQQAVANSFGHYSNGLAGPLSIPEDVASRRFYFKEWILALIKVLQSGDNPAATIDQINANPADPNHIFFDSVGGGFEQGEYVDNSTVNSANQAPTALSVITNLQTSVINNYTFTRHNFRGESALYTTLNDNPYSTSNPSGDRPGAETLYIQNMVGSPVLQLLFGSGAAGYTNATSSSAPIDTTEVPPAPLYAPYADAFGQTIFNIPALDGQPNNSGLIVDSADYELIQSAMVQVPVFTPPTGVGSTAKQNGYFPELIPYINGAGVGFPVTIDGSRDKFYNTQNVDFSGATVSASVDFEYDYTSNGTDGGTTQSTVIRAIETQSYLGQVFPCLEATPPGAVSTGAEGYDILGVRMYQNGADILNWITQHTVDGSDVVSDCGIQIKYSIYGNYADYISFGVNPGYPISGTRFGLNAGYGGSVVSAVTIFDPNIVASLGQ